MTLFDVLSMHGFLVLKKHDERLLYILFDRTLSTMGILLAVRLLALTFRVHPST